jgi:hypothetical protein
MLMDPEDRNGGREWLRSGVEVMGSLVLGAATSITSSVEASAAIGAATSLMTVASDMFSRALSQNENRRVRSVAAIAIDEFNFRIKEGWRPRQDGFWAAISILGILERRSLKEFFKLREENMKRVSCRTWLTCTFLSHLPILSRKVKQIE